MRTDYDDEPYTREEYQEHIRINKLSYRLPLVTDYIKNKLCDYNTIRQSLTPNIEHYFFNVFTDNEIRIMIETLENKLDYFTLLSYLVRGSFTGYHELDDLLRENNKFDVLKKSLVVYYKVELFAWDFEKPRPSRVYLYQDIVDEYTNNTVAKRIAISKLKRNKIVNLGILLKISMRESGVF
tara:strand:+ start:1225 stop:1770 length:546 start_codon:yes stop_codon:yes gene_type:complete